ncbi:hypothetical protein BV898_07432 [Hypsibius exemplaris]|uniref:Uncharacterized protein n=1 Tax=Hypsibius exemplaris TaxID=2072580 RepID=A0A1W0WT96_HYPEX|nr:hypothetical protein BV898_07432 [Hypsibius exemplaris]
MPSDNERRVEQRETADARKQERSAQISGTNRRSAATTKGESRVKQSRTRGWFTSKSDWQLGTSRGEFGTGTPKKLGCLRRYRWQGHGPEMTDRICSQLCHFL